MRMKIFCSSTKSLGRPSIRTTARNTARRSSITFRPISMPSASGARARSMHSRPRSATVSTATPAASSSRQKTPSRCVSSTRRSRTGRSTSAISASYTVRRVRRPESSKGSCSRTQRRTASTLRKRRRKAPRPASRSIIPCSPETV